MTLMATAGGAMLGYCAMGSVLMASAPPSIMTMASTQAKIGRSMKNSDTGDYFFGCEGAGAGAAVVLSSEGVTS